MNAHITRESARDPCASPAMPKKKVPAALPDTAQNSADCAGGCEALCNGALLENLSAIIKILLRGCLELPDPAAPHTLCGNFELECINLNGDYISDALAAQVGGIGIARC